MPEEGPRAQPGRAASACAGMSPLADEVASTEDILSTAAAGPAAVRGGAFRVAGYAAGTLLGLLSASLLFRHLGVEDTGRYVTAVSLVAIVAALSDLGLSSVGIREISVAPPGARWQIARDLLGLRLVMTAVGGVIVVAAAAFAYSAELAAGVALAAVGLMLQATQDNFYVSLVVDLRLGVVSALELLRQVLTTALIVLLVLVGARLVPFLAVPIPVGLLALIPTVMIVREHRSLRPTFSSTRWRTLLRAVLPYAAATAASALYFRVSILLVSALASGKQPGYFGASYRMIEVLALIPGLLVSAAFPIFSRAAREDHERLGYALGRVFEVALLVGAWLAVSIAVGASLAMQIVGGAAFKPAAPVLAIQGIALGAMFVSLVWANGLLSLALYRRILVINVAGLVLNAALVAALVPADGARGAAIGTAISEVVVAIAQAAAVVHGRPQLRPSFYVVPRVTLAAGLGLIPLAFDSLPVVVRLAISIVLFGATVIATRALPAELGALLPNSSLWQRIVR
jgi:O-antigen/teichoic acid export membrane protein